MIKGPNLELVIIIPEKLENTMSLGGKELEKSEAQKENERKAQNRGTVFAVGKKVEWPEKGAFVSFYRAAATEITEDGVVYFSVHQANVLCEFSTNAQG